RGGSIPPPPASHSLGTGALFARPHRLEAQDTARSRLKHGFESRWGHHTKSSTCASLPPCQGALVCTAGAPPEALCTTTHEREAAHDPTHPQADGMDRTRHPTHHVTDQP